MAEINFDRVSKTFGKTAAVRDLMLDVGDGEFLVLVGPSGCGKSTALRMVAGLEEITSGKIRIGGRTVNDLPPQSRDVAMVFQNYALYPHMTVWKNLAFPLKMLRLPKEEITRRVEKTAGLLELGTLLDRLPKQLSGGQRQRVAMGRAMVRQPSVFLMDEPLSNLDAKLRVQMRAEIVDLHRRLRTTTLYVTHDQVEAMTMGDRLAVLDRGQLQQVGQPQELYQRPANLFVATFIGSPSMNLFETSLERLSERQIGFRFGQKVVPMAPDRTSASAQTPGPLGERFIAGLRPEAFVPADRVPIAQTIDAIISSIEILGHEQLAYFDVHVTPAMAADCGENAVGASRPHTVTMAARLPSHLHLALHEHIRLGIDTQQLHFFDRDGLALGNR